MNAAPLLVHRDLCSFYLLERKTVHSSLYLFRLPSFENFRSDKVQP